MSETDPLAHLQDGSPLAGRAVARERREFIALMTSRVREAPLRKPYYVDGGTDLVTLCRDLSERGRTGALVRDGDRLGIFTTTDLRDALLRGVPPEKIPVRDVAIFEPQSSRARSGKTCSIGWTYSRSPSLRCASGRRTSLSSPGPSWRNSGGRWAGGWIRSRTRRWSA